MLSSIVNLLKKSGGALSVKEISLALAIDSSALHPMLEMLVGKGRLTKVELPCGTGCGGGCTQSDTMIFYKAKTES